MPTLGEDLPVEGTPYPELPGGALSLFDITMEERNDSRSIVSGVNQDREIRRYALWCNNESAIDDEYLEYYIRSKIENNAPAEVDGGLRPKIIRIEPQRGGIFHADVEYGLIDVTAGFEFDTTGGTTLMRQSFGTRRYGSGPVFGGLINCRDGKVEGVEITQPVMTFSETRSFLNVSNAYRNFLYRMTGRVNSGAFKGTAAGECLFMGARGRKQGRDNWTVQFNFACSENLTALSLAGGAVVVDSKLGWEYLWMYYEDKVDSDRLIPYPQAAYVEQTYLLADLTALGIGS
jgi:hypothetical protein